MDIEQKLIDNGCEGAKYLTNYSYDSAVIGYTHDNRIVYDFDLMVEWLMSNEGMDSMEWIDYNTIRALPYMGPDAPIVMYRRRTTVAVPRTKKQKIGTMPIKQHREASREELKTVMALFMTACADVLKPTEEELMKVVETSARYAEYMSDPVLQIRMTDICNNIYQKTNVDFRIKRTKNEIEQRRKIVNDMCKVLGGGI